MDETTPPPTPPSPSKTLSFRQSADAMSRGHHVPRKTGDVGMYLFLAALGMLFFSSILGYVAVRFTKMQNVMRPGSTDVVAYPATAPPLGSIHLPLGLWLSTLLILASSLTMHLALKHVRRERQAAFRRWLVVTLLLSIAFLLVQAPSMAMLLVEHFKADRSNTMLGLIFVLILLHALHVVGGIIPLSVVTYRAGQDRYDHEHYAPIRHVGLYWHFLDVVWLIMFAVLWVTG